MKSIWLVILLFLVSCGGGGGGKKSGSSVTPLKVELNEEEQILLNQLTQNEQLSQKETVKLVLKLKNLNGDILKRLDQHLVVDCFSNVCRFSKKDDL